MKILKYPDPILFEKTKDVTVFGKELLVLLEAMYQTMSDANGLGLAANQVNLNYNMCVMIGHNGEKMFLVNPKIIRQSVVPANIKEGCLSAPGEFLLLSERVAWVEVEFQDEKGEKHTKLFSGLKAVCIQHEIDHLQGKSHLMSKSIPKAKRKQLAKKWGFKLK